MAPNLEVIVGTYEQFLLGYTIDDVVNKYKMEQSFATHSHLASIRSVASNKHYLASAAADDTVCLYDMRNRTENGKLIHHSDTVNSICFTPDASHIITASSDGTIGIVRCGNWQVEKHWLKPHKGLSVDVIAVHPTGKIAMTTGHDGVLRTWNLVKGRQAYATNLVPRWKTDAKFVSVLKWSSDGQNYLIAANNKIDIYSVETAGVEKELSFISKVICAEYLSNECLAVGLTDGKICICDLEQGSQVEFQAHSTRVKCMAANEQLLVSASSSGEIKLWSFNDKKLKLLNQVNCNCRISCLTLTSCLKSNVQKDESEASENVPSVTPNKLRLKQQVIIEEEEDGRKKPKTPKSDRKKKARESGGDLMTDVQEPAESKNKKTKLDNSLSKKRKLDSSEELHGTIKKKILTGQKKRKETDGTVLDKPAIRKKKMKKAKIEVSQAMNSQAALKKKKRKVTVEEPVSSLPKKQKIIRNFVGKVSLKKKKKQKNFKNKISR